jgi:Zn-dependent peptidase ImmA (M78 family)
LSFSYVKRSVDELEQIAEVVLSRYAKRCSGCFVDVEGIVEDCELTILPRQGGLRKHVEGYVATNPHYIVVPEQLTSYAGRYRPVIAEELCHAILEYDFLSKGDKLPADAQPHALTKQQHSDIETDARYLALAILFPKQMFIQRFNQCMTAGSTDKGILLRACADKLEHAFHVWSLAVAYRARDLGLITDAECRKHFSDRLAL